MRIDFTDLRLFANVADMGSITRGAACTHLAPASGSERLKAMEGALGVALLERRRDGVRPTPAGEALLAHARAVLARLERMREDLRAFAGGSRGRVRMLSNTAALAELLPEALGRFLAAHPGIDVEVEEHASGVIARELAAGRAELGVLADSADLAGLQSFPLRLDLLVLVSPRAAPPRARRVAIDGVLAQGFVGLAAGAALQDYIEAACGGRMKIRARARDFDALCRMVAQGAGSGVVPLAAAKRWQRRIRIVHLTDSWATRTLTLAVCDAARLSPPARALFEALRP